MSRPLVVASAADPVELGRMLRAALTGEGPAVLPHPARPPASSAASGRVAAGSAASGGAASGVEAPPLPARVPPAVALVVETSGSTGVPKRVALSRDALLASAAASAAALGGTEAGPGSRQWLLCLPAHYVAGAQVLIRSIVAGTDPVIYGDGHFDPWAFGRAAAAMTGDARFVSLVPVQLARLVRAAVADPSLAAVMRRFDGILVGGQALEPALHAKAVAAGMRVVRTYGSSETGGGCVYDGVPFGPVRARVSGGELELGGPVLAEGYLGDEERTERLFHHDAGMRWYRTGDLGTVDAEGRVAVLGRADNVIISGGEKVLLDAVERAVRALPGLGGAVVVRAPDDEWGEVPVVVAARADADPAAEPVASGEPVATAEPAATGAPVATGEPGIPSHAGSREHGIPSLAEVRATVAAERGRAAAPAAVVEVERMPLLASGKPDRRALAELARSRRGGR